MNDKKHLFAITNEHIAVTDSGAMVAELNPNDAKDMGYDQFNGQPHLCVEIPDGGYTITCKTSEGKRITFAFQPYQNGYAPQCVDVHTNTSNKRNVWNGKDRPAQKVILFSGGRDAFHYNGENSAPVSLTCIVIGDE